MYSRADEWASTYGDLGLEPQTRLMQLPLDILDPWQSADGERQPFKAYAPEKLDELAQSIREHGVIEAICVRLKPNGRMEIIAGHNRVEAAKLAGLRTVPAIVQQLDDAQAAIMLVDSNLQHRETLLPSEKAFAYKLRLEAMKRQGQRTDLTSRQFVGKLEASDKLGEELGESGRQVQRYIRLTYLYPALLDMVDQGKPGFAAAVDLSFLSLDQQEALLRVMDEEKKVPNGAQAKQLRTAAAAGLLADEDAIRGILAPNAAPKPVILKISTDRLLPFFPPNSSPEEMEKIILAALEAYTNGGNGHEIHTS